MKVTLTVRASELLEAVRAKRAEPVELILEHALEVFANDQHINPLGFGSSEAHRQAVREMLDFTKQNRVHLGSGTSVKDLIREGHSV